MNYARLKLSFTKIADPGAEYIMKTDVDTPYSKPDEINTCLKIAKGDAGVDERLVRIAEYADIITSPLDLLPTTVDRFSAPSLASIGPPYAPLSVGDEIHIWTPFLWQQFFGMENTAIYVISLIISPTEVLVTPAFPAFGRNLIFAVRRGSIWILPPDGSNPLSWNQRRTDGLANRDYSGTSGAFLLASSHSDSWSDLTAANNLQIDLRAQAQSLVDVLNEDNYSGTSVEVFV